MEARDRVRSVTANEVLKSQDVSCGSFRFVAVARQGRITVEMATLSLNSDVRRFLDAFVSTNRAPEKPSSEARGDRRSERQACLIGALARENERKLFGRILRVTSLFSMATGVAGLARWREAP